jgi:hypothetical protein
MSDFGRPRNPSRPAPPPAQHHHQHSNTTSTDHTHGCEQGGIITTKPKLAAKASNHGHLNKIKCSKKQAKHQGGAGQARRGAKHQEGAGQATWGGAEQVPGALDQAQARASPTSQPAIHRS